MNSYPMKLSISIPFEGSSSLTVGSVGMLNRILGGQRFDFE
jgi:hypothetical protein